MGFIAERFSNIGFDHKESPAIYSYSTSDSMSQVVSSGYFNDARAQIQGGDLIIVDANGEFDLIVASDNNTARLNTPAGIVFVDSIGKLPLAVDGVITLEDYKAYHFTNILDLNGARIVGGVNSAILGSSSENSRIKSTGLSGSALISSEWTMPIRHITLEAGTILNLDATANAGQALDWYGVNFEGSTDIGLVKNYSNFICSSMAFLSVSGLVLDGTFGTIAFGDSLFVGSESGTIMSLPSTATIERRFRVNYSSCVVSGAAVGFDLSASASIPVEGYIFDTCNFSGGGTYTNGVTYLDNKARWTENRGITNSSAITGYYMHGNATATVISSTSTPVKVAGVTTQIAVSQRFTVTTSNRATYDGAIPRNFKVTAILSVTSGNGHQIGLYVAKNGSEISESETYVTTNASGRLENGTAQLVVSLVDTDYIEIFVENNTSTTNVTVNDMHVIIEPLN